MPRSVPRSRPRLDRRRTDHFSDDLRHRQGSDARRTARRRRRRQERRYRIDALGRHRRQRLLHDPRIAARRVRDARQPAGLRQRRRTSDARRGAGSRPQPHTEGDRHGRVDHRRRNRGHRRHAERGDVRRRDGEDDLRAAAERPQLHRPRAAAAGRQQLQREGQHVVIEPRDEAEHQRHELSIEQLSARRGEHEGVRGYGDGLRRRDDAGGRHDHGISRRHQRLLGRLRPRDGRRDQPRDEERHEPRPRLGLRVLPRQRDGRAQLLRSGRRSAAVHAPSVRSELRWSAAEGPALLLRRRRAAAGGSRHHDDFVRADRRRAIGCALSDQSDRGAVPEAVPGGERRRRERRAGHRHLHLREEPADARELLPGTLRLHVQRYRLGVCAIHVRRRRPERHCRISGLRHRFGVAQSVLHDRVQTGLQSRDSQHGALLAQPAPLRAAARLPLGARPLVHRGPGSDGRDQHQRFHVDRRNDHQPVDEQQLLLDVQRRSFLREGTPSAEGGSARRAPADEQAHGDQHPRQLHVREPSVVPRRHADALRRRTAGRTARARPAQYAVRRVRAGRLPGDRPAHAEPRPAIRVLYDSGGSQRARHHAARHRQRSIVHGRPAVR